MQLTTDPVAASLAAHGVAFAPQIARAAERHGLSPTLLAAVAAQETGGPGSNAGHNVVGDGGHGHGLFQIDDRWHAFARSPAAMDPAKNADYAAGMLSGLLKRYGGNLHAALSAYNAGSPNATGTTTTWRNGQTLGYADSVLQHASALGGTSLLAEAQAERSTAAENATGPLLAMATLAQGIGQPPSPPPPPSTPWQPSTPGVDATGHRKGQPTDYDAYVNGTSGAPAA